MPDANQIDIIDRLAKMIQDYGAMTIFGIVSGIINILVAYMILTGRLVSKSLYDRAVSDRDKLFDSMLREKDRYLKEIKQFMASLKKSEGDNGHGNPPNNRS